MSIIDHASKLVVGHALGKAENIELALETWRGTQKTLKKYGLKIEGIIVHHDQNGVYLGLDGYINWPFGIKYAFPIRRMGLKAMSIWSHSMAVSNL